jgi:hypothetical protein
MRRLYALVPALLLAAAAGGPVSTAVQPWPAAQHDPRRTARASVRGPQRLNIRHVYRLGPAEGTGQPVVSLSGRAYVGASYCVEPGPSGCGRYWRPILALMPDGSIGVLDPDMQRSSHGSPAIGPDETLYVSTDAGTIAYAPEGSVRWQSAGGRVSPVVGPGGFVYTVGGAGLRVDLLLLDAVTGFVVRRTQLADLPVAFAVGAGGRVHYVGSGGALIALDEHGAERWRFRPGGPLRDALVLAPDGTAYVTIPGRVFAIDPSGAVKWEASPADAFGVGYELALAGDGVLYVHNLNGITALSPSGAPVWQQERPSGLGLVLGTDRTAYIEDDQGIDALGPLGGPRWHLQLGPLAVISGMAIGADGTLFAVAGRVAYALAR